MYRLLLLFLIFYVLDHIDGFQEYRRRYRPLPDYRYQKNQPANFEEMSNLNEVLRSHGNSDALFERFCYEYSRVEPSIIYGFEDCVFKYAVPYSAKFNIDVRIKNKVLRTLVIMNTDDPDFNSFTDVRVLPDILDYKEAVWSINYGELSITIPYRIPLGIEFTAGCDTVDNEVVFVPISQASQSPPEESISQEATSQEATSQEAKSRERTSQESTSQKATSQESTSQESTSQESTSQESTTKKSKKPKFHYRMMD